MPTPESLLLGRLGVSETSGRYHCSHNPPLAEIVSWTSTRITIEGLEERSLIGLLDKSRYMETLFLVRFSLRGSNLISDVYRSLVRRESSNRP